MTDKAQNGVNGGEMKIVTPKDAQNTSSKTDNVSAAIVQAKKDAQKFKREAAKEKLIADELRAKMKTFEDRVSSLEKENQTLSNEKRVAETKLEHLQEQYDRLRAEASSGEAGTAEVVNQLQKQLEEINKKALKSEQDRDEALGKLRTTVEELKNTEDTVGELKKELEQSKKDAKEMAELKDKKISNLMSADAGQNSDAAKLQVRIDELEEKVVEARALERKNNIVEFNKLKKKFQDAWKAQEAKFNQMKTSWNQLKTERDSAAQKLKVAASQFSRMKTSIAQYKKTIEKLEKDSADAKSNAVSSEDEMKKQKEAFEKERLENKGKVDNAESLQKKVDELEKERDEWFEKAATLSATITCVKPLSTATPATVALSDTPTEDFVVQWFRSANDGSFIVIDGATKPKYHCTVDDLGCVLKATCTRLKDGLTASAFTGRVVPHPKLLPVVRNFLQKDEAALELFSSGKNAPRKLIVLSGKKNKMKYRHDKETKQKAEFNPDLKIELDNKVPNQFSIKMDKKSQMVKFTTKTPSDRDTFVLTIRAFNNLHLYQQKQHKLPKNRRDIHTAPLQVILMSMVGGNLQGETENSQRMRMGMLSRSMSRRVSKDGNDPTNMVSSETGQMKAKDETSDGKTENSKAEEKKESKKPSRIDLSKYMNKEKKEEENFWSSDDEEETKKIKVVIKTEEEMAKENAEKEKRAKPSSSASGFALGSPGLGAPTQRRRNRHSRQSPRASKSAVNSPRSSRSLRATTPKSILRGGHDETAEDVSESSKKKRGTRKSKSKTRASQASSKASSVASIPPLASSRTNTKSTLGHVEEERKEEIKKEPQPEPKKNLDPVDLFFGAPAKTPSKSPSASLDKFTVHVAESVEYRVKQMKITKMGPVSGEVTLRRRGNDLSAQNISIKMKDEDGNEAKFKTFMTPFMERKKGEVYASVRQGLPSVMASKYSVDLHQRRIPFKGHLMWKIQETNAAAALQWVANHEALTKSCDAKFTLKLYGNIDQCVGKGAVLNKDGKLEWSSNLGRFDSALKTMVWDETISADQYGGRQQAAIKCAKKIDAAPISVTVRTTGSSSSLSGLSVVDGDGKKLHVIYDYILNIVVEA
eukprot:CAMPEP_0114496416 /NCGR_PEP_ID=MMETSP0109-20121206/5756_1 /TAXON_ID=29199 /ORGANISM="Chlorarachnion reptans, Strain CCCM449" /LENGTH=1099 /DNA_ID=CAMNT_0001673683 /DNA_START=83 /DNA_END=3382 /DNA_ORIENTATION=-